MSEIIKYEVAFPKYRATGQMLQSSSTVKSQHCICYVDEDLFTLSFSAASKIIDESCAIDAIFFATSTPVFKERYHASFMADLLGLKQGIFAMDIISTARAGTDALLLADKLVNAGQYKNILLIAANVDFAAIGDENQSSGHAAMAMVISTEKGLAEISSSESFSSSFAEEFYYKGQKTVYDLRFSRSAGFKANIENAWIKTAPQNGKFGGIIINSPYARMILGIMKKSGFDTDKQLLKDNVKSMVGNTAACHALLLLISAIENCNGSVLLFDYMNGTNVISLKIKSKPDIPKLANLEFINIESYHDYLKLRKQGDFTDINYRHQEMFSSEMMMEREKGRLLYLMADECTKCHSVFLIKIARCNHCHGKEFFEKKLQRKGTVYTLTSELYFPSSFPPINMIVIDIDGGGRLTLQQTDDLYSTEENKIKIGDRVELVYRKMIENDSKPNYFWKCIKI